MVLKWDDFKKKTVNTVHPEILENFAEIHVLIGTHLKSNDIFNEF
jgi:hypothetical protein